MPVELKWAQPWAPVCLIILLGEGQGDCRPRLPFRLLGMGGINERGHLLKGRSGSDCRTYSSNLKEWVLLPLGTFLLFVQTFIKVSATLSIFVLHGCEGMRKVNTRFYGMAEGTPLMGTYTCKGSQEGPRSFIFSLFYRVGQEPKAARSCPPANRLSLGQYEDGLISGSQITWTWALKGLSWEMPGVQHLETLGPCLKSQLFCLGKGATSPRGSWVWVQPLLLGKGWASSPSQLTAWQVKLGHIHKSHACLHSGQIHALSKVRYGLIHS